MQWSYRRYASSARVHARIGNCGESGPAAPRSVRVRVAPSSLVAGQPTAGYASQLRHAAARPPGRAAAEATRRAVGEGFIDSATGGRNRLPSVEDGANSSIRNGSGFVVIGM